MFHLIRILYGIYALVLFVSIMLLIFPFVLIASLFGRITGGNIIYRLCMFWGDLWFPLVGIRIKRIFESKPDYSRPCIFISNHNSYLDAAIIVMAFRKPIRPLGKVEMSKVPVFGFIYKNAIVSVDRSSKHNRIRSIRILRSVLSKGISILVFPEGTFNLTGKPLKEFYDGAFRVALESGTNIRPVLFLDAWDRMNPRSIFSINPGKCRLVYLDEIDISPYLPDDHQGLKDKVYSIMAQRLIHYKASWIKTENKGKTPNGY